MNHSESAVTMLYANITMDNYSVGDSLNHSVYGNLQGSSSPSRPNYTVFLFVFFTLITGLLCLLGFIGNFICIVVLQKDGGGTAHAATLLLQALAVADNLVLGMSFIFLSIIYGLLPMLNAIEARTKLIPYIVVYIQPIAAMAQTATVWMTVLLAVNRYIAVCRPLETPRFASLKRTKVQVVIVFAFAFILNFPRFFQHKIAHRWHKGFNMTMPYYKQTAIGPRTLFGSIYTTWLYTIVVLLLPLLLLLVLNTKLILELRNMGKRRKDSIRTRKKRKLEANITLVMIVIILVFIICNTPDRVNELVKYFKRPRGEPGWFYFDCVSQFFVVVNSSTNFLIYYIFRRRFRRILFQKMCCKRCGVYTVVHKSSSQNPVCESIVK